MSLQQLRASFLEQSSSFDGIPHTHVCFFFAEDRSLTLDSAGVATCDSCDLTGPGSLVAGRIAGIEASFFLWLLLWSPRNAPAAAEVDFPPAASCSNDEEVSLFSVLLFPRAECARCPELKRRQLTGAQPRRKLQVVKDLHV